MRMGMGVVCCVVEGDGVVWKVGERWNGGERWVGKTAYFGGDG